MFVFVSHPLPTFASQLPNPGEQTSVQAPAVQVGAAFTVEHAAPHALQFVVFVFRLVSQPLVAFASQLPKPAVHVKVQLPVPQEGVAFAALHVVPQEPQSESVFRLVSHPLFGLPSQLANPAAQVGTHAPAVHVNVPFAFEQEIPHEPQLAVLVFRFASQPFAALASQLPKPALHVPSAQTPVLHRAAAFAYVQVFPHEPQLVVVEFVFVSHPFAAFPSQLPNPALQLGTHAPVVHAVVPCAFVQLVAHVPHAVSVVFRFVSHPFAESASQSPKPALQAPRVQAPPTHVSAAFARLQTAPQPPQSVSVLMLFSQPLSGLPSQLANPAAHVGEHAPAVQVVEPFVFEHTVGHAPQCAVVFSEASQPFDATASQLPKPLEQVNVHAPVVHWLVALVALQVVPHVPQFVRLFEEFVSHPFAGLPSQSLNVPEQTGTHAPATQLVVPFVLLQIVPHAPQFEALTLVLVSHPFCVLPSQLPKPAPQTGTHAPPAQLVVPFAFVHALPHALQFAELVFRFVSHPFVALPSQLAKPALHVGVHVPVVQLVVPFAFVQPLPQLPQFAVVVFRFVSHPFPTFASQLPKPALHAIEHEESAQPAVPFTPLHAAPHPPQFAALVSVLVSQPFTALPSQLP